MHPTLLTNSRALLLSLAFPNAGTISTTQNLGVVRADSTDPNVLLSPETGFDFTFGCVYSSLNLASIASQTDAPAVLFEFFIVDSTGADLYACGSASDVLTAGVTTFSTMQIQIHAGSTPGSGIRGQLTIIGTYSILVPTPVTFFGSMASG
jgi:hypothetical protein